MLTAGRACLIVALAICRLRHRRVALRRARAAGASWVASGRRAVYALAGLLAVAFVILEAAFVRSDFSLRARRDALLDHDAALLPADRGLVLAGGLAAAVGAAARRSGRARSCS